MFCDGVFGVKSCHRCYLLPVYTCIGYFWPNCTRIGCVWVFVLVGGRGIECVTQAWLKVRELL
jgi:hypothetical protein